MTVPSANKSNDLEHLDVLVVGAGLSGIGAGHYIQADCPWASYAIFEARDAIGGTWDLFRYPGIRSDSDMFTLGYSFRPWDDDRSIGDGDSILEYIKETARVEGIDQKIRFNHRIISADWRTDEGNYLVTAERTDTGDKIQLTAGFIFSCSGYYRYDRGHQPDFPGLDDFAGQVIHPQAWPEDLDYVGKKVVVIGSGATAVTLIPSMSDDTELITMLQRSPSYIAALPGKNPISVLVRRILPRQQSGTVLKWINAVMTQGMFQVSKRFPEFMKKVLIKQVAANLPDDFDVDRHFTPKYNPWDQRLCLDPDGALFKAISRGDAAVVTDTIDTFTEKGIRLESGDHLDADIVISATGLELLFIGGIAVSVDGEEVDIPKSLTYKGMMLSGLPNFAMAIGYTNASWTLKCDLTCDYVAKLLNYMRAEGVAQCTPTNNDPTISEAPLLGLTSGYVKRAEDQFPKQGSRFPWQTHMNYLKDYRVLKRSKIDDGAMVFSNPPPVTERPELVDAAS